MDSIFNWNNSFTSELIVLFFLEMVQFDLIIFTLCSKLIFLGFNFIEHVFFVVSMPSKEIKQQCAMGNVKSFGAQ